MQLISLIKFPLKKIEIHSRIDAIEHFNFCATSQKFHLILYDKSRAFLKLSV